MNRGQKLKLQKPNKIRSKAIRQSARGESCSLRRPGICNHNPETTVLAHLPGNKGTGTKNHDIFAVYACSDCHDWLDDRGFMPLEAHHGWDVLKALQETQIKLYEKGLIKCE